MEESQQSNEQGALDAQRQLWPTLTEFVGGSAENVFGDNMVAAPNTDIRSVGIRRSVTGDVGTGVADAHDQHPFAAEFGFSDAREFRRAYLGWTGPPSATRASAKPTSRVRISSPGS